jgi:plasmid stabilization system protein ParE
MLTEAADADIREIARYTHQKWGEAQARMYLDTLERCTERLVAGDAPFKDLSSLIPSLRMSRCEHHYIVCLPRDDGPALIVALVHERMDLVSRLRGRLP